MEWTLLSLQQSITARLLRLGQEFDFIEAEIIRLKHEANNVASYSFFLLMDQCVTSETQPICFVSIEKVKQAEDIFRTLDN